MKVAIPFDTPSRFRLAMAIVALAVTTSVPINTVAEELKNRMVILFAVKSNDKYLREQVGILGQVTGGLAERDVVVEQVLGKDRRSAKLRRKFRVEDDFHVLLIGRDGHVALSSHHPQKPEQLFKVIDAMPMRKEEMRRARSGKSSGKPGVR